MDNLIMTILVYLLLSLITSVFYTKYYYNRKLKPHFTNASARQKRQAITITFLGGFILAPMVFIEYLIGNFKEETK